MSRFWWVLLVWGCKGATPELTDEPVVTPIPPLPEGVPPVTASRSTVLGHAQECAQVLGPIPGFDCLDDADPVPVQVAGVDSAHNPSNCDMPSLLEGSCNSWSRAGSKQGVNHDGTPKPEVTFVFTCRSSDTAPPTKEGGIYHDVAMIGHNRDTGATCYFQSFPQQRIRAFPSPGTAGHVPDLGTTPAEQIWDRPAATASIGCNGCHSADPWIHSPWIDQLRSRLDPTQPLVPWTGSNQSPYHVVGTAFSDWSMSHFAFESNACASCHRIGTGGCEDFVSYSVGGESFLPLSPEAEGRRWMPPEFTGDDAEFAAVWQASVDEIAACCRNPGRQGCNVTPTPEGDRLLDPDAPTSLPPPTDTGVGDTGTVTDPPCVAPAMELGGVVGASVFTGTTCGAGNNFEGHCGGSFGADVALSWTAPAAGSYRFDTDGSTFDTVLQLRTSCASGNDVLACNDDWNAVQSRVDRTFAAGETVIVVVDGYGGGDCGDAVLNITAL